MHTLKIEVTDEVYESLRKSAERSGEQPEVVAAKLIAHGAQMAKEDPLRKLFGTLETHVPDWGDRHDHYIGESLLAEIYPPDPESSNGS